jgi:hypothetical protein
MCEQFSKVPHARRVVFLFDRDNPAIVGSMEDAATGYKNWGNNVFSLCIPQPAHRAGYQRVAIESYYTDAELRTVDPLTGYRLVFSNEVSKVIESNLTNKGQSKVRIRLLHQPIAADELEKFVYDQDAENICNDADQRVAHSKTVFAQRVATATPPFHNFGLPGFHGLFERLRNVLNAP